VLGGLFFVFFPVKSGVAPHAGGGNDRCCRRRVCAAAEPVAAQCAALVLPQRLHGALRVGADPRRARAELPEATHVDALVRLPKRGGSDQPGNACASRRPRACASKYARGNRSSGSSATSTATCAAANDASGARRSAGCSAT